MTFRMAKQSVSSPNCIEEERKRERAQLTLMNPELCDKHGVRHVRVFIIFQGSTMPPKLVTDRTGNCPKTI